MRAKLGRGEMVIRLGVELLLSANKSMKGRVGARSEVVSLIQLCTPLRKSEAMATPV